jgi:hypothetical protein
MVLPAGQGNAATRSRATTDEGDPSSARTTVIGAGVDTGYLQSLIGRGERLLPKA